MRAQRRQFGGGLTTTGETGKRASAAAAAPGLNAYTFQHLGSYIHMCQTPGDMFMFSSIYVCGLVEIDSALWQH